MRKARKGTRAGRTSCRARRDRDRCRRSPRAAGRKPVVLDNKGELHEQLLIREASADAHGRYEAADRRVKELLRKAKVKRAVCGEFAIEGTKKHREGYRVPDSEYIRYEIVRIVGTGRGKG